MSTFKTAKKLQQHLINHVLSPPESLGWGLVWRGRFPCLADDPTAIDHCYRLRKLGQEPPGRPVPNDEIDSEIKPNPDAELYRKLSAAYEAETSKSHQRSQRLGWMTERAGVSVHFDPYGIALVMRWKEGRGYVKTAYLPGFGAREQIARSQLDPENVHGRVRSGMRARGATSSGSAAETKRPHWQDSGQPRKSQANENQDIWQRLDHRWATAWDDDQKLYHLVFRPSVQVIRRYQPMDYSTIWKLARRKPRKSEGEPRGAVRREIHKLAVGAIKSLLPKQSELKFDSWKRLKMLSEQKASSNIRQECHEEEMK